MDDSTIDFLSQGQGVKQPGVNECKKKALLYEDHLQGKVLHFSNGHAYFKMKLSFV